MLKNIHALLSFMPRVKLSSYNHRKKTCFKSKVNTMRFKNSFINRLVFKNELAICNILDFLILTSTETLSSLLKCISARIHTFATHCTLSNIPIPATTFSLLHKSATPSFNAVKS